MRTLGGPAEARMGGLARAVDDRWLAGGRHQHTHEYRDETRRTMKAYEQVAIDFAQALVEARWEHARGYLTEELQARWPEHELAKTFRAMYEGYAEAPATSTLFDQELSMDEWSAKEAADVGWVYIGVLGDDFVEAVTVVVTSSQNRLAIQDIKWGRP